VTQWTGPFSIAPTPQLHFGSGKFSVLHSTIRTYGKNVLLITGARSFLTSEQGAALPDQLRGAGFSFEHFIIPQSLRQQ
jgi:alcohol dehydrogenase YqhD (iron-dependent ADH family)